MTQNPQAMEEIDVCNYIGKKSMAKSIIKKGNVKEKPIIWRKRLQPTAKTKTAVTHQRVKDHQPTAKK